MVGRTPWTARDALVPLPHQPTAPRLPAPRVLSGVLPAKLRSLLAGTTTGGEEGDVWRSSCAARRDQSPEAGGHSRRDRNPVRLSPLACLAGIARIPRAPQPDIVVTVAWLEPATVRHARVPRTIVPSPAPQRSRLPGYGSRRING